MSPLLRLPCLASTLADRLTPYWTFPCCEKTAVCPILCSAQDKLVRLHHLTGILHREQELELLWLLLYGEFSRHAVKKVRPPVGRIRCKAEGRTSLAQIHR